MWKMLSDGEEIKSHPPRPTLSFLCHFVRYTWIIFPTQLLNEDEANNNFLSEAETPEIT